MCNKIRVKNEVTAAMQGQGREGMMTREDKWAATKRGVKMVRRNYQRYITEYEVITGSQGQVAPWGRVGGSGGRISCPTQERAMAHMAQEERLKQMKDWFECVRHTCERLAAPEGKGMNLRRHQQMLARALRMYVFEQADGEMLALLLSGVRRVSSRFALRLLREAVEEVMADADRRGLFETAQEASAM